MIDKPAGPTSHDVVQRVRRRLPTPRAGHTGTLDPLATGVLAVVVGEAAKLVPLLAGVDKVYEAEATLGVETDTLDAEGRVVAATPEGPWPTAASIGAAVADLAGRRLQRPPAYSAVKVRGRPLHERTRRGEAAEAPGRAIEVYEARCLAVEEPGEGGGGPRVRFRVWCSKGTYVRVLAADLGRALGCGAHLSALRRTRSGPFTIEQAVPLAGLDTAAGVERAREALVAPWEAVAHLPRVDLDEASADRLAQGQGVPWPLDAARTSTASPLRVATATRPLVALAECRPGPGGGSFLWPTRVFAFD